MLAIVAFTSVIMASAVSAANHTVVVGGAAGLKFVPETITAEVGDFVTYIFQARNHTVTQSAFAAPCKLLENATINAVGFDSGFVPVAADATEFPAWTIEITAKAPIWYYCAQGNHCAQGMVGAINAPAEGERTFEKFKALAAAVAAPAPAGSAGSPYGGSPYGGSAAAGVPAGGASSWSAGAPSAPASSISATTTGVNVGRVSSGTAGSSQVAAATDAAAARQAGDTGAANVKMHVAFVVTCLSFTLSGIMLFA